VKCLNFRPSQAKYYLTKSATPSENSCSSVVENKMVVMQDATTYPIVKDDCPFSHSELQAKIAEVPVV